MKKPYDCEHRGPDIEEKEKFLKPCPFCGGSAWIDEIPPHTHVFFTDIPDCDGESFVFCENCSAAVSADTTDEVISLWNRRA